jgi:tetratricopeptide (TPR) repeat protein
MPSGQGERYDFFLSRRGSVAAIAQEVADVLSEKGYRVLVQDYDIPLGASFVEAMHEAVINSRDLIILFTEDYLRSPYTRKEFTSFEAERVKTAEERHIIVLRCEDVPLRGLLADNVYQTLVGIDDPEERKHRIIAAAERQSQAVPPPPRPFIGVPPRIASFTGRVDELDRIDAILMRDQPAAATQTSVGRAAVQGMGGVGKTSLAIEYAYCYRNLYAGVCWCPAETRASLLSALAGLAVSLGATTSEETDLEKAAKAALRRLSEQRATWLLVYDNVTAPDHIADLLPSAGARVLITSRFSDWGEVAVEVALDVLPLEEAVALLENRAGREDAAGARTLAEALGNLPLALDHAAAYCKRTQMQLGDYTKKASSLIAAAPRGAGYPRSVAATFDLAITEAVVQCQVAEALMSYLAQCAPERIPMTLVEGAVEDETERMQALAALAEVSLLRHDPFEDGSPAVTVHRLVQAVARARSAANGSAQETVGRLTARLVATYPEDGYTNPQSWPLCEKLTPHLLARRGPDDASVAGVLARASGYFHGRAAYSQAARLLRDTLAIREKTLGSEHPLTATTLSNLALVLQGQGDLAGARPLQERALAIHEKALGPEHPQTATTLNNLAQLLKQQGDFAGARPLQERALAISEKTLGPEHPVTATKLNNLATLLLAHGDLAGARPLMERVLAIEEKALGPEHPQTATTLNNLAYLLKQQGDLAGARPLYERALAIQEKVLGPEHPQTATSLSNLASLLHAQGDRAGALPLMARVLAIEEKALGPEHPQTATSLTYLALLLQLQGDRAGARPLYERALAIQEKVLGPEHPDTATGLSNLAYLLHAQGDLAGARPLYQRALAIQEKVLGPEHPDTATSLSNLAFLLHAQGDLAGARPLYERALAIDEHPNTNLVRNNLSRLLLLIGHSTQALTLGETALTAHDKAIGPNHPWTKDSARVTADALDALGRTEQAKALRERYSLIEADKPKPS